MKVKVYNLEKLNNSEKMAFLSFINKSIPKHEHEIIIEPHQVKHVFNGKIYNPLTWFNWEWVVKI